MFKYAVPFIPSIFGFYAGKYIFSPIFSYIEKFRLERENFKEERERIKQEILDKIY